MATPMDAVLRALSAGLVRATIIGGRVVFDA
jgi:hypothetical protein